MKKDADLKINNKPEKLNTKEITKNVLVFASGNGSNFEAIVKHFKNKNVNFELITDNKNAYALIRAKKMGVKANFVEFEGLYDFLTKYFQEGKTVDLFVLAGFMRILPQKILNFGTFINIHPSLLPEFKGKNAIEKAFRAGKEKTGVTVHFVNKGVDAGKIIEQRSVCLKNLELFELEQEIHKIEHEMYPEIIENLLFKKNVLVLGGGAREHAIAEHIKLSPFLNRLYLANPNDGFKNLGETIEFQNYQELLKKSLELKIDLLVVGPENPLCEGIADIFIKKGICVIGANKHWAQLEGSKIFAKKFMQKHNIKTADYITISADLKTEPTALDLKINKAFLEFKNSTDKLLPPVIKADGPAFGKGVLVPKTFMQAKIAAKKMLEGQFGEASKTILLEQRLFGQEISVMSLWDGKNLVSFPPASDYKKLKNNDKGKNTGGMGSFAPSRITKKQKNELKNYLKKLENALTEEKADFTGIIYSGLMLTQNGIYVLEYNMRFGDPEIQSLLELLKNDLLDIFLKTVSNKLSKCDIFLKKKRAYCVVTGSSGYPDNPKKGAVIENLEEARKNGCKIYYAGVKKSKNPVDGKILMVTNGGRVLNIVNSGKNALKKIYKTAEKIKYKGKIFRKDIGK